MFYLRGRQGKHVEQERKIDDERTNIESYDGIKLSEQSNLLDSDSIIRKLFKGAFRRQTSSKPAHVPHKFSSFMAIGSHIKASN